MRQMRWFLIGLASFFTVISSTFWKRAIAVSLCGVLGANSPACYLVNDGRVAAGETQTYGTTLMAEGVDIFDNQNGGNNTPDNTDIFNNPNPTSSSQPGDSRNNTPSSNSSRDDAVKNTSDSGNSKVYSFFINGIQNSESDYAQTKLLAQNLLQSAGVNSSKVHMDTYNYSSIDNARKLNELAEKLEQINRERSSRLKNPLVQVITEGLILSSIVERGKSFIGDLFESIGQDFSGKVKTSDGQALISAITKSIKEADKKEAEKACKNKNKPKAKFVIIAHSQGNYFADEVAATLPDDLPKRTVIIGLSPWHSYGKSQAKGVKVKGILRSEDISGVRFKVLRKVSQSLNLPEPTISNLPTLPKYTDSHGKLIESNIFDNHSLKDYLATPTKPEYAKAADESFSFTAKTLKNLLNFDAGKYDINQDCRPSITTQITQKPVSASEKLPVKNCQVPKEFFKNKRVVRGIRLDDYICVIRNPVMTKEGFADGNTACGVCDVWGNFGMPPSKSSCNSRQIDPDRSNEVPTCPENWGG